MFGSRPFFLPRQCGAAGWLVSLVARVGLVGKGHVEARYKRGKMRCGAVRCGPMRVLAWWEGGGGEGWMGGKDGVLGLGLGLGRGGDGMGLWGGGIVVLGELGRIVRSVLLCSAVVCGFNEWKRWKGEGSRVDRRRVV